MKYLTQEQTIERLCALATEVGISLNGYTEPHDCFCHHQKSAFSGANYKMTEEYIKFIEDVVNKALLENERYL